MSWLVSTFSPDLPVLVFHIIPIAIALSYLSTVGPLLSVLWSGFDSLIEWRFALVVRLVPLPRCVAPILVDVVIFGRPEGHIGCGGYVEGTAAALVLERNISKGLFMAVIEVLPVDGKNDPPIGRGFLQGDFVFFHAAFAFAFRS